jgi:Kef-type K+ transport system membrane component KefB
MTPFLQFAIALAFFITTAKLGGYLSIRIGQPAVLGELIMGIILGPSVLHLLNIPYFTDQHLLDVIHLMAEMGVLLLMFLAGLDLHISDLLRSGKVALLAGTLGVITPLGFGTLTGVLFSMEFQPAIFIGLILSATSVSISAQTLMELKVLRSRVGVGLLGAAVFDDILVLLCLSVFTALTQTESGAGLIRILSIVLKMVFFLGIASVIGRWALPKLSRRISDLPVSQGLIGFTFVTILLYGWSAEMIGQMAAITGAFLAGLWFGRTPEKERIHNGIAILAYGVFVPVFFINIGLSVNARELNWESGLLMLVLVVVAVISKVLGSGYGAFLGGFTRREALQLGVGMMSRGEVGLIVAAIGIEQGLIQDSTFSAVVGVVILTTLLTPLILRALFPKNQAAMAKAKNTSGGDGS